jgi:hypothetical protein
MPAAFRSSPIPFRQALFAAFDRGVPPSDTRATSDVPQDLAAQLGSEVLPRLLTSGRRERPWRPYDRDLYATLGAYASDPSLKLEELTSRHRSRASADTAVRS